MKKILKETKRAMAVLLSSVVAVVSVPESGTYVYAAAVQETESLLPESETAEEGDSRPEGETAEEGDSQPEGATVEEGDSRSESETAEEETFGSESEAADSLQEENHAKVDSGLESEGAGSPEGEEGGGQGLLPPAEEDIAEDGAEYLIDEECGYALREVEVVSQNYAALIYAKSDEWMYNFHILYTTDSELAGQFFPGVTSAAASDVAGKGFVAKEILLHTVYHAGGDVGAKYTMEGECRLNPETTYYYRLARYDADTKEYSFLTLPDEVTTGAAVETSKVAVQNVEIEEAGYRQAKIS